MIPYRSKNDGGFALVLVLAFILLVLTVALAFFSNSVLQRQISTSSANQGKVDLFAQGALDTTIGDLKQEIIAGSSIPAGTTGIYWPLTPANMMPTRVGTIDALPNLVKTSVSGQSFYTGGPTGRASLLSTGTSSTHPISTARWNAPALLPMPTGHSSTDFTPITGTTGFTAPNWIYVDRSGNNPQAVTTDTVGRYAYCIYDEGGLLDMNVAGYPAEMDPAQASHKIGSSFADLTQVGLTTPQIDTLLGWRNYASAQPTGSFPSYVFEATTSGLNYFNSVLSHPWGFMAVASGMTAATPTTLYQGQTDQKFVSRQQLISFLTQAPVSASPDVLQYMGTFNRALDQPSFRPDPNRPLVKANAGSPTVGSRYTAPAAGGNDALGLDDLVNPFFLGVTVTSSFLRNDNTQAIVGEPLVKKRFALNRLAWVTYKGPSADNMSDPEVLQTITGLGGKPVPTDPIYQFVALGTGPKIQQYFGLTWNSSAGYWVYDHGIAGNNIGKLSDVQALAPGREPDFFELLKAALTVGALGKTSGSLSGIVNDVTYLAANDIGQYNADTTTAYQVLQIGANMIDQFDADSYPTHILYTTTGTSGTVSHDIYGSESLPYLYRTRSIGVNFTSSLPSWAAMLLLPEVWNPYANSPTGNLAPTNFRLLTTGGSSRAIGSTPTWNSDGNPAASPPKANSLSNSTMFEPPASSGPAVSLDTPPTPGQTELWSPSGLTEIDFGLPTNSNTAREPFFVGGEDSGSQFNSSMHPGTNNLLKTLSHGAQFDSNGYLVEGASLSNIPKKAFCGVVLGTFQNQWVSVTPGPTLGNTIPLPYTQADPSQTQWNALNPSSATGCITINPLTTSPSPSASNNPAEYVLQYQDATGNWVIYQDNLGELPGNASLSNVKEPAVAYKSTPLPISQDITIPATVVGTSLQTGQWTTWMDPRTSRFGTPGNSFEGIGTADEETYVTNKGYYGVSDRPDYHFGCGCNLFTPGTGLPLSTYSAVSAASANSIGWYGYSGGWDYGAAGTESAFVPGFYADNVTLSRVADNAAIISHYTGPNYFADPDGVVRRGMGGYVGPTESPTNTSTVGLPLAALASSATQSTSRPYMLNRPFRSVAELGYVFSGTPWRNLDMSSPESGAAALLDTFCISETPDPNGLVAGKVNLNTRQAPVLQALLSGSAGAGSAYKDEANPGSAGTATELSSTEITAIAQKLVARTTSTLPGQGALENLAELIGKYNATVNTSGPAPFNIDGTQSYVGFTSDLVNKSNSLDQAFTDPNTLYIQRLRDSAIRALSAGGQTRVWNLMIDLVAQTGKYRPAETSLDKFLVDGERRYWLHVAIDRFTGKVLDEQIEQVNE